MKTQEQRDRETVVITRAMVGFAVVTFVAIVLFQLTSAVTAGLDDSSDMLVQVIVGVVVAGLACAPLTYLYRHRRP